MAENKLNLRDIEIYRPYTNEGPEPLLMASGVDDADIERWLAAEIVRVAKRDEHVLGAYAMTRSSDDTFHLLGVVIDPVVRRQGLGRWLTGHAIGVAESKGGRHISVAQRGGSRMFDRLGFVQREGHWVFDVIPE